MGVFEKLFALNVNDHTEKKKTGSTELTYLSWSYAWAETKKAYPEASYVIKRNESGLPYVYDENTGYMVFTEVTIEGITHEMWLPVMDGANKAMKSKPYTYEVAEWAYGRKTGNMIEKTVEAATMFDINKTIMRCLVKNLAMFGLGLYIFAGEDLPESEEPAPESKQEAPKQEAPKKEAKPSPTVAQQTMSDVDIAILKELCKKANVNPQDIANKCNVADISMIGNKQYVSFTRWLQGVIDGNKGQN